ncbi:hypothetical protein DPMN_072034 [Dreissena polymorpha]|uniref:Uncharacterized protein n=1 Tax=Dreissena polymorpha TaxID=45954 RepID=A0A9D4BWN1_DREPO|nr:hypothetical protein DPMN_072034 [Dreissena polymorpha]
MVTNQTLVSLTNNRPHLLDGYQPNSCIPHKQQTTSSRWLSTKLLYPSQTTDHIFSMVTNQALVSLTNNRPHLLDGYQPNSCIPHKQQTTSSPWLPTKLLYLSQTTDHIFSMVTNQTLVSLTNNRPHLLDGYRPNSCISHKQQTTSSRWLPTKLLHPSQTTNHIFSMVITKLLYPTQTTDHIFSMVTDQTLVSLTNNRPHLLDGYQPNTCIPHKQQTTSS